MLHIHDQIGMMNVLWWIPEINQLCKVYLTDWKVQYIQNTNSYGEKNMKNIWTSLLWELYFGVINKTHFYRVKYFIINI